MKKFAGLSFSELKSFLDEKYGQFNVLAFIDDDPVSILRFSNRKGAKTQRKNLCVLCVSVVKSYSTTKVLTIQREITLCVLCASAVKNHTQQRALP